jgi:hypothetical protein
LDIHWEEEKKISAAIQDSRGDTDGKDSKPNEHVANETGRND